MRPASSSGGTPIVKERRPRPFRPAISWLAGLVEAIHSGGCGFWSGFGSTRRGGTRKCVPSQENTSVVHAPTITSRASSHMPRLLRVDAEAFQLVARRGAPGAELEAPVAHAIEQGRHLGGADRVVVGEGQETDAVADADRLRARRDRAVEHLGRGAVRELGEEVVLDGPEVREPA